MGKLLPHSIHFAGDPLTWLRSGPVTVASQAPWAPPAPGASGWVRTCPVVAQGRNVRGRVLRETCDEAERGTMWQSPRSTNTSTWNNTMTSLDQACPTDSSVLDMLFIRQARPILYITISCQATQVWAVAVPAPVASPRPPREHGRPGWGGCWRAVFGGRGGRGHPLWSRTCPPAGHNLSSKLWAEPRKTAL